MNFPYKPRDVQRQIIRDVERVLEINSHLVLESPTGSGKTIGVLYPVAKFALEHEKKVLYLVHTNSQEQQVIREAKKLGVKAVAMQGRIHMCPLTRERRDMQNGSPADLSLLCSKLKKDVQEGKDEACPYFHNYLKNGKIMRERIREGHTAEEIFQIGMELKMCPYEAIKDYLQEADIIVFPYIYFFYPFMRRTILDKIGISMQDIILVVDEAHNIPEFARELRSMELTVRTLEGMEREALEFGNPQVLGHSLADVAEFVKEAIYKMEKFEKDGEGIIPQYAFEEEISTLLKVGMNKIDNLANNLLYYGEMIRENKVKERKLPRSHIYHVGSFLYLWKKSYSYEYIRLIKWGPAPALEIYCMDPVLVTEIIRNVHTSIHLSGTLQLEEYRNIVGLPEETLLKRYSWPLLNKNLKILYVSDVTTKYREVDKFIEKYAQYLTRILNLKKNTVIFFPSYSLLRKIGEKIEEKVLKEERSMKGPALFDMVEKFKNEGGAILSVMGGKIFEGLDFPGKQLEIVVIVGIPYPKPTPKIKALERYYDSKFGDGWEYAFRYPALIKMRQAIGRLIRSERDRGVAIILDKRAPSFSREIKMEKSTNLEKDIMNFLKEHEKGEEGRHRDM